jgi:hypothetical protein
MIPLNWQQVTPSQSQIKPPELSLEEEQDSLTKKINLMLQAEWLLLLYYDYHHFIAILYTIFCL